MSLKPDLASLPLLISSSPVSTSETYPIYSPQTSSIFWQSPSASPSDALSAVASSAAAFSQWRRTSLAARRSLLLRAAEALESRSDILKTAMQLETAASERWADFNVSAAATFIRGVAARVTSISAEVPGDLRDPSMRAEVRPEPYGVVLSCAPWNAPVILAVRSIVFPLAAGNTVVFKSSERSPWTHMLVAECFQEAEGWPKGAVNAISCSRDSAAEVTEALIAAREVRKVNFTGSTMVGQKIAELCGKYLKPVTLELGGKAPMIVFRDADLEKAATAAVFGGFAYAGQICMSAERVIVEEEVKEKLVELLKGKVGEMYGETQNMISVESREKGLQLIRDAETKGAVVHYAQVEAEANGHAEKSETAAPNTIVNNVTPEMDIWRTESFFPVIAVCSFATEREAIGKANDTEYGLSAAVWSKDLAKARRVADEIVSGAVHINGPTVHDEIGLPHGGAKSSGWGRFGGTWGVREFMWEKTITTRG